MARLAAGGGGPKPPRVTRKPPPPSPRQGRPLGAGLGSRPVVRRVQQQAPPAPKVRAQEFHQAQGTGSGSTPARVDKPTPTTRPPKPQAAQHSSGLLATVLADLPRELKGAGAVEHAVTGAGEAVSSNKTVRKLAGATVRGMLPAFYAAPKLSEKIGANAVKDAFNIPAEALPSAYLPVRDLATGHAGRAIKTLTQPYIDFAKNPVKSAIDHPVGTALLLRGGEAALGRGAGAAMRTGALGTAAKDAASTARPDLALTGKMAEQRSYSPDVIEKAIQVRRNTNQATGHALNRKLARRASEEIDAAEKIRRAHRAEVAQREHQALPQGNAGHLTSLVTEGTVRHPDTVVTDLGTRRTHLKQQQANLRGGELTDNKRQVKQIDAVLNDRQLMASPHHAFDAAVAYAQRQKPVEDALVQHGQITRAQVQRPKLIPYAVQHMPGVHWDHVKADLVDAHGTRVENSQIIDHMKANGVNPDQIGFFSQRPGARGAASYLVNSTRRPAAASKSRTGASTVKGTYAIGRERLIEQQVHNQGIIDAAKAVNQIVDVAGIKREGGKFFNTAAQANAEARRLHEQNPHAPELVPFDAAALFSPKHQLQAMHGNVDPVTLAQHGSQFGLDTEAAANPGDTGRIVLMPKAFVDTVREHGQTGSTDIGKLGQAVTQAFRHTVLPLSAKWMFGNTIEHGLRLGLEHGVKSPVSIPASYLAGKKLLATVPEDVRQQLEARALPGQHFSMAQNIDIHQSADRFSDRSRLRGAAGFAEAVAHTPPAQVVGATWRAYRDNVFKLNQKIERSAAITALGKQGRAEWKEMSGGWHEALRLGDQAVKDLANGLTETNAQVRYARKVDDVLGQYSKFSPGTRRFIQNFAPFWAWTRNAMKFVAVTVPVKHPIAAATLAAAYEGTGQQRKSAGLDEFMQGRVPDFLQGSIPVAGGKVRVSSYTPFGAFSDLPGTVAGAILPQGSGMLKAMEGLNWKNGRLVMANGQPPNEVERFLIGLYSTAEATVPGLALARTLREQGGSPYDNSTAVAPKVRPGTKTSVGQALRKHFAPLSTTTNRQGTGKTSGPVSVTPVSVTPVPVTPVPVQPIK